MKTDIFESTDRFIEGRYYKWVGPKSKKGLREWNFEGLMDFILDGRPNKALSVIGDNVVFENASGRSWFWGANKKYLAECDYNGVVV